MLLANQTTGYCVQLGSYREYSNAHRHAMNMQNKGVQNVFLKQEQHASGGIMYKVVVAAFATSYDAQVHLQELRSQGVEGVVAQLR
jgi:cell division protein FtsN